MGACASKFTVSNSVDGAPEEPVETRDVKLAEETVKRGTATVEAPAGEEEEAKRQSLGEWFKENEGAEVLAKNPAPVADAPAKDEAGKAPVTDDLEFKTSEEKKTGDKSGTEKKTEEQDLISRVEKKPDAPEMEVTEEQKTASDKEKKETTIEAKQAELTKLEIVVKLEDKPALEAYQTEKPVDESVADKKPVTPELEHEVQKSGLDAEEKEKEELKHVVTEKEPETELRPILDAEKEKTEKPTEIKDKQKTEEKLTATEASTKVAVEPASDTQLPRTEK